MQGGGGRMMVVSKDAHNLHGYRVAFIIFSKKCFCMETCFNVISQRKIKRIWIVNAQKCFQMIPRRGHLYSEQQCPVLYKAYEIARINPNRRKCETLTFQKKCVYQFCCCWKFCDLSGFLERFKIYPAQISSWQKKSRKLTL